MSHAYEASGTYSVQLTVIDNQGASASTSRSVTVSAPNAPPVATFSYSCTGLSCSFTDQSTDGDGTIAARAWSFGDHASSTVANPSHTFAAADTYQVSLPCTDDGGATDTVAKSVTVSSGSTPPPTAAHRLGWRAADGI